VLVPPFDIYSVFYMLVGGCVAVLAMSLVAWGLGRFTIVSVLWVLTGWFGLMGLALQGLGVYYEIGTPKADGLLMMVLGAAFLSLAGLVATVASKKEEERTLKGIFPKGLDSGSVKS
jgi:hypothetical protein